MRLTRKKNIRSNMGNNIRAKTNERKNPNGTIKEEYDRINKKEENGCPTP